MRNTNCKVAMKNLVYLFMVIPTLVCAQLNFNFEELKQKYSDYTAVTLEKTEEIVLDLVQDSVMALQNTSEKILILNDNGKAFSGDKLYSSSFSKITKIDAKTYIPKSNGKYKSIKVNEFNEVDEMSSHVFYDDSKAITYTYPAIQKGAVTSVNYQMIYSDTRFLTAFFFKSFTPVINSTLTLKVNKHIDISYKGFHLDNVKYSFTETETEKFKIYTWTANNVEEFKFGGDKIGISHYSPHIVYYITKVNVNGEEKKQYGTVADLYRFYFEYIKGVDTTANEELKKKSEEITKGIIDEEEKVKAILYWVRSNIKYVAFEQGMRGFIPNAGCSVFNHKFGDCKDMSSLIVTMLNSIGIKSYIAWTGTRHIPYTYEELPLPKVDNHMVAVYMRDSKPLILDGTISYLEYGMPPYLLQGKEILVSLSETKFKVFDVPVLDYTMNNSNALYNIKISGDSIIGDGSRQYIGYEKTDILHDLHDIKESDLKKAILQYVTIGSNKFDLKSYNYEGFEGEPNPLQLKCKFNVPDYVKSLDDEVYVNLNIEKTLADFKMDTATREVPMENDFCFKNSFTTNLIIPDGYKIEYLPENSKFENELFGFEINYLATEHNIVQEKHIYLKFLLLHKGEFNLWNNMINELVEAYRESVVLKLKALN